MSKVLILELLFKKLRFTHVVITRVRSIRKNRNRALSLLEDKVRSDILLSSGYTAITQALYMTSIRIAIIRTYNKLP